MRLSSSPRQVGRHKCTFIDCVWVCVRVLRTIAPLTQGLCNYLNIDCIACGTWAYWPVYTNQSKPNSAQRLFLLFIMVVVVNKLFLFLFPLPCNANGLIVAFLILPHCRIEYFIWPGLKLQKSQSEVKAIVVVLVVIVIPPTTHSVAWLK